MLRFREPLIYVSNNWNSIWIYTIDAESLLHNHCLVLVHISKAYDNMRQWTIYSFYVAIMPFVTACHHIVVLLARFEGADLWTAVNLWAAHRIRAYMKTDYESETNAGERDVAWGSFGTSTLLIHTTCIACTYRNVMCEVLDWHYRFAVFIWQCKRVNSFAVHTFAFRSRSQLV